MGSPENQEYAFKDDDEARAFLQFSKDGVDLRQNYLDVGTASSQIEEASGVAGYSVGN